MIINNIIGSVSLWQSYIFTSDYPLDVFVKALPLIETGCTPVTFGKIPVSVVPDTLFR